MAPRGSDEVIELQDLTTPEDLPPSYESVMQDEPPPSYNSLFPISIETAEKFANEVQKKFKIWSVSMMVVISFLTIVLLRDYKMPFKVWFFVPVIVVLMLPIIESAWMQNVNLLKWVARETIFFAVFFVLIGLENAIAHGLLSKDDSSYKSYGTFYLLLLILFISALYQLRLIRKYTERLEVLEYVKEMHGIPPTPPPARPQWVPPPNRSFPVLSGFSFVDP